MLLHAVRILYRNPKFTIPAVFTLALGIGANTALYSVVNALLLRPLPGVSQPERLVTLKRLQLNNPDYVFGYPDFLDYRSQTTTLSGMAAHIRCPLQFVHDRLRGDLVSGEYFQVLGVRPSIGRLLDSNDDSPVAVLSYGLWQRSFGSNAGVIGSVLQLNGHSFTVVGVAGKAFRGTVPGAPVDIWLPLKVQPFVIPRLSDGILHSRTAGWLNVFGRLRPGVTLDQARAELGTIAAQLARAYPQTNGHRGVDMLPGLGLDPDDKDALAAFFKVLLCAVGVLLVMACANVAGLMLIRTSARQREIAIRRATGASTGQIVRQLLAEGALLSILAALVALAITPWVANLLLAFRQPLYLTIGLDVTPDWKVLASALLLSVATGLALSVVPALRAVSLRPARSRARSQSLLVVVQVAISLVLLVGAGLAVRTLRNVLGSDLGFQARNLLLVPVERTPAGYTELLERVGRLPGVQSASLATTVPPRDFSSRISVFYQGQAPSPEELRGHEFELGLRVDADTMAPGFFQTMGVPILRGRDFSLHDNATAPRVAILSDKLAQRLWPGENAIGRHIEIPEPVEIVGVVKDIKYRSLLLPPPLLIYLPVFQNYTGNETLVLRSVGDPAALLPSLRTTGLQLSRAKTLSDEIAESLWQQQIAAGLIGAFGILALLLSAIGIYAVISHWVLQGTHDIGIRLAVGAQTGEILRMVLGRGLGLTLLGLVIGIPVALTANRLLAGLLFGITPEDPFTFATASLLITASAMLATFIPARRATRVDPVTALRSE